MTPTALIADPATRVATHLRPLDLDLLDRELDTRDTPLGDTDPARALSMLYATRALDAMLHCRRSDLNPTEVLDGILHHIEQLPDEFRHYVHHGLACILGHVMLWRTDRSWRGLPLLESFDFAVEKGMFPVDDAGAALVWVADTLWANATDNRSTESCATDVATTRVALTACFWALMGTASPCATLWSMMTA